MNPWQLLMERGSPSPEDLQAQYPSESPRSAVEINAWAGIPEDTQVDPSGNPQIRGKIRKSDMKWERQPSGMIQGTEHNIRYEDKS